MTDDVVAELEALINPRNIDRGLTLSALLTRARDEIVRLRRDCSALADWAVPVARAEALEEAARVCDRIGLDGFASDGAAAIRALKEKGDG